VFEDAFGYDRRIYVRNFEGTIPQDDGPIARLATCTGAILVTKGKDLKAAAAKLKVVSPEKAIEYAMFSDPRA
jgi:hypothetical protein